MDLVFALLTFATGLFALVFDRATANAMNCLSIALGEAFPQWGWPTALPPWSRERFENWLWFTRLWAAFMLVDGMVLLLGL
jgi:hypothetical protein